ncbi:MAG: hypothetical protein PHQ43_01200, partial [Dehalococcoidales bacterium]|nr:hypothetical protein [Dehalococcoidales bacterium]
MKNKILKIMGVVMAVAMLASFMVAGMPVSAVGGPLSSNASVNNFVNVNLPSTVAGTDVLLLAQDGNTLYAAVYEPAPGSPDTTNSYWVKMSTDGGYTWKDTTMDEEWYDTANATPHLGTIVDMVVSPAGDGVLYVAFLGNGTAGSPVIYKIAGEGTGTITSIRTIVNEADDQATKLFDIDVYYDATSKVNYVMAATDIDALVIRDAGSFSEWTPLELVESGYGGIGVVEACFAPDFANSSIIWAIYDTYDGTGTSDHLALASTTGNGNWNSTYDEIVFNNTDVDYAVTSEGATAVDIAFPD